MFRRFIKIVVFLAVVLIAVLIIFRGLAALREMETAEQARPPEGRIIQTHMGRDHILEFGPENGVPLLLVHGSVGWSGFWGDTLTFLADDGYRVIAIDLIPMGYSERDPDDEGERPDYARTEQAERLMALLEAMKVRPILVAHSFGAGPGMEAVLRNRDAFQGAVIVAGAIGLNSHENPKPVPLPLRSGLVRELAVSATITNPWAIEPLLKLFIARKDSVTPEHIETLNRPMRVKGTTSAIADWLPSLLSSPEDARSTRPESYQVLRGFPVVYLWGALDTVTPVSQGEALQRITPGSTLHIQQDVGHIPHIENPDGFHQSLSKALTEVVRQSASN